MKTGRYTVFSYNGKDAALVHEDGSFEVLAKVEFPVCFRGVVYVGEIIVVDETGKYPDARIDIGRQRTQYQDCSPQLRRLKDLEIREANRRALYCGRAH